MRHFASESDVKCLIHSDCVLQCVAVCCSALQCVAVCCNVLQCVAVWCSVLTSELDVKCLIHSDVKRLIQRGGGLGSSTIFKNLMSPTPRRKWYVTTGRRATRPHPPISPRTFFWVSTPAPHLFSFIRMWNASFVFDIPHDSFTRDTCDRTHSNAGIDSDVTCLIHVRHPTWLIHVWHTLFDYQLSMIENEFSMTNYE